jgi:hypothetical protein
VGINNLIFNPSPALVSPSVSTSIVMADGAWIGQAAGPQITFDDTNNYLEIMGCNVGIGTTIPANDKLHIITTGFDGTYGKGILIESEAGAAGIGPAIQFKNADAGNWVVFARDGVAYKTLAFYSITHSAYALELYNTSAFLGTDMWLYANYAGSGELPPGGFFGSRQDAGYSFVPSAEGGVAGTNTRVVMGYYNQTQWFSACEVANVASGYGTLKLMKSGGNVGIGTSAPLSELCINGGLHVGGDSDAGDNNLLVDGTGTITGGFGCNAATAQTAYASGGALAGYVTGAFGLDSDAHMQGLFDLVTKIRAALVANGIMS